VGSGIIDEYTCSLLPLIVIWLFLNLHNLSRVLCHITELIISIEFHFDNDYFVCSTRPLFSFIPVTCNTIRTFFTLCSAFNIIHLGLQTWVLYLRVTTCFVVSRCCSITDTVPPATLLGGVYPVPLSVLTDIFCYPNSMTCPFLAQS